MGKEGVAEEDGNAAVAVPHCSTAVSRHGGEAAIAKEATALLAGMATNSSQAPSPPAPPDPMGC